MFIVLEGLDGAGKSTQIRMLRQLFADRGVDCSDASGAMESPEGIFAKIRAELTPILGADA